VRRKGQLLKRVCVGEVAQIVAQSRDEERPQASWRREGELSPLQ
jgi:hypothetical protein